MIARLDRQPLIVLLYHIFLPITSSASDFATDGIGTVAGRIIWCPIPAIRNHLDLIWRAGCDRFIRFTIPTVEDKKSDMFPASFAIDNSTTRKIYLISDARIVTDNNLSPISRGNGSEPNYGTGGECEASKNVAFHMFCVPWLDRCRVDKNGCDCDGIDGWN